MNTQLKDKPITKKPLLSKMTKTNNKTQLKDSKKKYIGDPIGQAHDEWVKKHKDMTPKRESSSWEKELRENSWDTDKGIMTKCKVMIKGVHTGWLTEAVTLDLVIAKIKSEKQKSFNLGKEKELEFTNGLLEEQILRDEERFNKIREELVKRIEGDKKGFIHGVNLVPEGDGCEACEKIRTHNQALDDVLSILQSSEEGPDTLQTKEI